LAAVPSIGRASLVEAPRVAPQAAATQGLYERHAEKIQSYCQHQLGSREEAEDAVQTTFMNAFRALGRGVVPEAESAWLFKIAENVCLSRRRSSWRRGRIESPSDFNVIEEIVPGPSRQRDELIGIEDALASMPEQQRRAILLREWQGLSYREIAAELEVSQSAVETLIFRARRSLAQGLEQPDTIKPQKKAPRKSFRRALHMIDLGTIAAAAKTLLAGSAAVKATAAAVAVTAAVGTAATVGPKQDSRTPAKPATALVAPVVAEPSSPSSSSVSFAASTAGTAESASKPRALTTPLSSKQKPARADGSRSAPAAGVPATAEPVEPAQAKPAEQPVAEPTPAPVAEEPKHESTPPAAEPTKRTDEGKKDEGKKDEGKHKGRGAEPAPAPVVEPVAAAPVAVTPRERRGGNSKQRDNDPKGKDAPVNEALAPASVTSAAPAVVEEAKNQDSKRERGRGRGKQRELTAATTAPPVPTPVVTTPAPAPTPVVEAAAAPAPQPAPVAESTDGKRRGRGK